MCVFYEGLDYSRGIRVVPRAFGSSLGDGLLCFMGVDVLVVGAGLVPALSRATTRVAPTRRQFNCRGEVVSPAIVPDKLGQ